MPEYLIEQKIKTVVQLWEPFEYGGFQFEALEVNLSAGTQNGWVARKNLSADSVNVAYQNFFAELYPLADRISLVTQCYLFLELEPHLVRRTDRSEFYLRLTQETGVVPLHFGQRELASLEALEGYEQKGDAFRLMREAINTSGFYPRLAMLASALEALAGEKQPNKTDREYIAQEILRDEDLCDKIFKYGTGIRNQILHGREVDYHEHGNNNYPNIIYINIINYLNREHNANINTDVINAPRTIGENYRGWSGWLVPRDENTEITLLRFLGRDIIEAMDDFEILDGMPDKF